MIGASAASALSTAGTPSGWPWRRRRGCCPIWSRCSAGSPAITPARCTRVTRSTASCTSRRGAAAGRPRRRAEAAVAGVRRRASRTGKCWTGGSPRCSSEIAQWAVTSLSIPVAVLSRARRAADAFRALTGVAVDAAELLTGRAALLGLSPQGRISAGGATRLMRSSDGWCALTLSRQDDVDAVPALLESDAVGDDPWPAVQRWVAEQCVRRRHRAGAPARSSGRRPRRNTQPRHRGSRRWAPPPRRAA